MYTHLAIFKLNGWTFCSIQCVCVCVCVCGTYINFTAWQIHSLIWQEPSPTRICHIHHVLETSLWHSDSSAPNKYSRGKKYFFEQQKQYDWMPSSSRAPMRANIYVLNSTAYTATLIEEFWYHSRKNKRLVLLPWGRVDSGSSQLLRHREWWFLRQQKVAEAWESPFTFMWCR